MAPVSEACTHLSNMLLSRKLSILCVYAISCAIPVSSFLGITIRNNHSLVNKKSLPASQTRSGTPRAETHETGTAVLVPPGLLGPPEPLKSLEIGQHVNAFRTLQYDDNSERVDFAIERVGESPDIFLLRNFVPESECTEIMSNAEESGMEVAGTVTKDDASSRKECSVAWLGSSNEHTKTTAIVNGLVSSTVNIFLSQSVQSHPSAGVEDLQVLRYGTGGEFVHHHDGEPRILTVIYYINGVGGTWFPLAGAFNEKESQRKEPSNKAQSLSMVKDLQPGEDGLLVKGDGSHGEDDGTKHEKRDRITFVNRGDAIAFYGYKDDGSARLDWKAIHCGLPTSDEEGIKWIANHWYRVNALSDL